jgi:sulfate transport system permease protein
MRRFILCLLALLVVLLFLVLPLAVVYAQAFMRGVQPVWEALTDPEAVSALNTTLLVTGITVPINTLGGIAAAWCITRFSFPGRGLLTVFIELPLSVSPVVSGLMWMLLFGAQGWFGPALQRAGIHIVFAGPGLVLATMFVTFPFVARQLLPLMQAQGSDEEAAAVTLGATGWQTFWRVTLPNIRWALLQGILLCTARAAGEFGAVTVVSGHVTGDTMTLPLYIDALMGGFQAQAAFSVAALLTLLALLTIAARAIMEWRTRREPALAGEALGQ